MMGRQSEDKISDESEQSATLTSLPIEIIDRLVSFLDRSSALSFSLISRRYTAVADKSLWSTLILTVPAEGKSTPYQLNKLQQSERLAVETAHNRRLSNYRAKLLQIIDQGDTKRWSMVGTMTVTPYTGTVDRMEEIIKLASERVHHLNLVSPLDNLSYYPRPYHTLEENLLKDWDQYNLPSLTHLTLSNAFTHIETIIFFLRNAAPNLLCFSGSVHTDCADYEIERAPSSYSHRFVDKDIKLQRLHIEYAGCECGKPDHADKIESIIKHSHQLSHLSIDYGPDGEVPFGQAGGSLAGIAAMVSELKALKDFSWGQMDLESFVSASSSKSKIDLPGCRRLVLLWRDWNLPSTYLPSLPSVERLYLNVTCRANYDDENGGDEESEFHFFSQKPFDTEMCPTFAKWVIESPRLRSFTLCYLKNTLGLTVFDTLDDLHRNSTCSIRSIRFGEQELIHARFYLQDVGVVSYIDDDSEGESSPGLKRIFRTRGDEADLRNSDLGVEKQRPPLYQDLLYFDGLAPPLSIMERMRRVEQASLKDWEGRNVEIKKGTYKILADWKLEQAGL